MGKVLTMGGHGIRVLILGGHETWVIILGGNGYATRVSH